VTIKRTYIVKEGRTDSLGRTNQTAYWAGWSVETDERQVRSQCFYATDDMWKRYLTSYCATHEEARARAKADLEEAVR
jgi:hypothetical protein